MINPSPHYDLEAFRNQIELTRQGVAYLNHAGMSPLPVPSKIAMIDALDRMSSSGSDAYAEILFPVAKRLKSCLARLVNSVPAEIAFIENTSIGLNILAQSLPLVLGDSVLICDAEFPSNVYAWQNLATKGVEVRVTPSANGGMSLDAVDDVRDERTKVVAVSGIQFLSGRREDLTVLGEY